MFRKKILFNSLQQRTDHEIFNKIMPFVSLIGIIGNPAFYLICRSLGFYDNLILRITASVLFLILFIIKRNTGLFYLMYSEFVYFFTLPFLFSFFLYANDQNLYWKLSVLFAGGAYGTLARKVENSLLIIPLSCMLSFVFTNFLIHTTPVSVFYDSIPTILSALGCALVMILAKTTLKTFIFLSIEMASDRKLLQEQHKLKKIAEDNILLQRDIRTGQRLRMVAYLSSGISKEIENTLSIIKTNAIQIAAKCNDINKKEKIQTVLNIVENASTSINHFWDIPKISPEETDIS